MGGHDLVNPPLRSSLELPILGWRLTRPQLALRNAVQDLDRSFLIRRCTPAMLISSRSLEAITGMVCGLRPGLKAQAAIAAA
jgi:hypothetical protein